MVKKVIFLFVSQFERLESSNKYKKKDFKSKIL